MSILDPRSNQRSPMSILDPRYMRSLILMSLAMLAGCSNPSANVDLAQQLQEMGDVISETRGETAQLRVELDSLRGVIARQDTVIRQLSSMAGVPYAR
jgi:hypothetical protein